MEYKYKEENIPNTIATAIFKNKKQNKEDGINFNEVYREVVSLLRHPLSRRQFNKHVGNMAHEKLLNRYDATGKRGSRVYLSLTKKGKREYDLKILGDGIEVQRRKKLYSLLIYFEVYKRGPVLTERQLARLLKAVGSSINDFKRSKELTQQAYHIPGTFYKSIKGIEILGIPRYDPRTKSSKTWYYIIIPGFSVDEFVAYQNALKIGMEPRPFLNSRTVIPFVLHTSYTKKEVKEAIVSSEGSGLFQPVEPVFPGEKRYNIADESIRGLVRAMWMVSMIDFELLSLRLLFNSPTERDRGYLEIYVGQSIANRIINQAYHVRRSKKEERHIRKQAIGEIEEQRGRFVQEITSKFDNVIQNNEIVRDIAEQICYPSFLSS